MSCCLYYSIFRSHRVINACQMLKSSYHLINFGPNLLITNDSFIKKKTWLNLTSYRLSKKFVKFELEEAELQTNTRSD